MHKVHQITVRISANGENEHHENSRSAILRKDLPALHEIPTGNKHSDSKQIQYDIGCMCSKACFTITCLCIWIIHIHIVTSH